jgi:hypothetical protein
VPEAAIGIDANQEIRPTYREAVAQAKSDQRSGRCRRATHA